MHIDESYTINELTASVYSTSVTQSHPDAAAAVAATSEQLWRHSNTSSGGDSGV